ncbi:AAA family ATPase [Spirosoma taeanense]|uniref:AAA family ATPase n=1 Tax=Spirosoma taeanense TaxID=2735870 RepID=A0A6M5YB05_9BACT|nr:AAA family ATPase [Spirosoma taeanense]QJW91347.1 AAA family ATPase [Spirosoma taeanense]
MDIELPERALVLLIGVSSSGKSTFARQHFQPTEVVSSDHYRAVVADDDNDQSATKDAFELVHLVVEKRLRRGLLTVIDATNLQAIDRRDYLNMARQYGTEAVALVFNLPTRVLMDRHYARPDRFFSESVLERQIHRLQTTMHDLPFEGFQAIYTFNSPDEVAEAVVSRRGQPSGARLQTGPFDIVGDVHGCYDELVELLTKLGYVQDPSAPLINRTLVFVGDLIDRGPNSVGVLRLVMQLVQNGTALCVIGNHDDKLRRKLRGNNVQLMHGLAETVAQLNAEPPAFREQVRQFLEGLPHYIQLDNGQLLVAHAGLREDLHGRSGEVVRSFCLFGATTGKNDDYGLPVRLNWAADYRGKPTIVYGHTPVADAIWQNNTIDIDTGCAFGGKLTALRYPERELISVPARRQYAVPSRPFLPA